MHFQFDKFALERERERKREKERGSERERWGELARERRVKEH